jgi:hypothetical protein
MNSIFGTAALTPAQLEFVGSPDDEGKGDCVQRLNAPCDITIERRR